MARDRAGSLTRPPYARLALAYAIVLSLVEFVLLATAPALFRAVVVADAATGWVIAFAAIQGVRAVPFPPAFRWTAIVALATGHWLAAVAGAIGVLASG